MTTASRLSRPQLELTPDTLVRDRAHAVAATADSKSDEHGLDEEAARQLVLRQLVGNEGPIGSLAVLSLAVMPTLVFVNQRVGKEMGSRALVADSEKTWVCS